jgi:hypothetical protein
MSDSPPPRTSGEVGRIDPHDLGMVAMRSDPRTRAMLDVFSVDDTMRANYDALRAQVIEQLSPVIVIQPDLSGGTYTLIANGAQRSAHPASPVFQLAKSVCHSPLGLFSILAPYLKGPATAEWAAPLTAFRGVLATGRDALADCGLPEEGVLASREILTASIQFADAALAAGTFSIEQFEDFTRGVHVAIETNMRLAAEDLVAGVERQLSEWRDALGPEAWRELYVVILAIWTTQVRNQHWVILNRMMDPANVDDHLITLSVGETSEVTIPEALDNLARIVQDKIAAVMVFSAPEDARLQVALADPTDLLADAVEAAMKSCPHLAAGHVGGDRLSAGA